MATSLGELFIELGVLGDDEGAKKVAKSIDEVIEKAAKAAKELQKQKKSTDEVDSSSDSAAKKIAVAAGKIGALITAVNFAVIALNRLTNSLVQQNQQWINLIRTSDIALSTYQKWGQVGAALDASLGEEGAAGAVAELNKRLFEMKLTGEGYGGFAFAGIMPTDAEDVLEQVRARIKGLNDTAATAILERVGIDPRLLPMLRMTREEFEALNAEMARYRLTPEQRLQIQEFHKQMSIVNVKMQYFKDRIILKLMPYFLNFMRNVAFFTDKLFKLAKAVNKLAGNFKPLIAIALMFIAKIKPIAKFLTALNTAFGGLITKIPIVGRLIAALGGVFSKAFMPLTILYLLLDDLRAYMEGSGSMIGVYLAFIQKIEDAINFDCPEWIKNLMYIISKADNLTTAVQEVKGAVKDIQNGENVKVSLPQAAWNFGKMLNPAWRATEWVGRQIYNYATDNTKNNQDQSKQFVQNNYISTTETSQAVINQLPFMRVQFG